MADSRNWYFDEIVDHEDIQYAFDALEAADKAQMADLGLAGLISGGAISNVTTSGTSSVDVAPFLGIDKNGARVTMAAPLTVLLANDEAGNPTLPSSGHVKWLTIAVHYAKFGSDHVLDGDGLDVYTTQTETISSEMGALDVDHNAALNGTLRLIQGTEAATIGAAGRPAVSSPDIIIADLAIDHTGYVIGGLGGVSTARTNRVASKLSGAAQTLNFDVGQYVLIEEHVFDTAGVCARRYVGRTYPSGPPVAASAIRTINAKWDGVLQVWVADDAAKEATLVQESAGTITFNTRTSGGSSWTDARHDPAGWDARITLDLSATANADTKITAAGVITANGPQTAFMALGFYAMPGYPTTGGGANVQVGATFPQAMAAVPSSQTLSVEASTNLGSFTASATALGATVNGIVSADSSFTQVRAHVTSIP